MSEKESAHVEVMAEAEKRAAAAKGDDKTEAETEVHRLKGKIAARAMLLKATRKVRIKHDCQTSKGRLCCGMEPRLPSREADKLVAVRAAEELQA